MKSLHISWYIEVILVNASSGSVFMPCKEIECYHISSRGDLMDPSIPFHYHDACEIYLFLHGNVKVDVEQVCFHMNRGDLVIINPNELHRIVCLDDLLYEREYIYIKLPVIFRLSSQRTNLVECFEAYKKNKKTIIRFSEKQIERFLWLTSELRRFSENNLYGQDVMTDSYLVQILHLVNSAYRESSCTPVNIMSDLVRETMIYVKSHLGEPFTLDDISSYFHLNGNYVSRQFKKHTGLTLRAYILDEKIENARILLEKGKNVSDACYLSGFSDYSNFLRSFKKLVGISPGEFRRTHKQG